MHLYPDDSSGNNVDPGSAWILPCSSISLPRAVASPTSGASSHPFASSLCGVTPWKAWPAQEEYLTTAWSFDSLLKKGLGEEI